MGKALYRTYRSTSFDEVIGQDHITKTLQNSLKSNSLAHAYLLTGPRGVGKTSVARILAFAANDLPYNSDGNHLDIIEIDAASNRRIDEIRDLRQKVHIAPTSAKYKVYIIDEVHMLTKEAFNALLKTLEEPPEHVIFILATTDAHKLPDTIISRCINFTFRAIDDQAIVKHLKEIAKKESLKIDDEALQLLAKHGDGSFRDSISLLDQIKNTNTTGISKADIEIALGLAPLNVIEAILSSVYAGNPKELDASLKLAYQHGADEANLAKQIAEAVRNDMLNNKLHIPSHAATQLLKELLDVPGSPKPRSALELGLLQVLFEQKPAKITVLEPTTTPEPIVNSEPATLKPTHVQEPLKPEPEQKAIIELEPAEPSELWDQILEQLKKQNITLYGMARMAKVIQKNDEVELHFKFPFHHKQISQSKNKAILETIAKDLGHKNIQFGIHLTTTTKQPDPLANITNIFGASEVLES